MFKNSTIWQMIKRYRWNSIFLKYAVTLCVFIILPLTILTFTFFFRSYKVSVDAKNNHKCNYYSEKFSSAFNGILDTVYTTQGLLFDNVSFSDYFGSDEISTNEQALNISQMRSYLQNICASSEYIDSIHIYNSKNNYVISTLQNSYLDNFSDKSFLGSSYDDLLKNHIIYRTASIDGISKEYITVCSNANLYGFYDKLIVYNVDCNALLNIVNSSDNFIDKFYIVAPGNSILFSNDRGIVGKDFTPLSYEKNMVTCLPSSSYYTAFTYRTADGSDKSYITMLAVYTLLILLVLFISVFVLSKRFFCLLIDIMNIFGDGGEQDKSKNELQYIIKNINVLNMRNKSVEERLAEQYTQLKHSQAAVLQSQINPHFIFNVLHTISLIDINQNGESTEITHIIDMLSHLLRASMNQKKYIIPFELELAYTDEYVALQNIKYCNRFSYIKEIAPETLSLCVIKFILQPIVENCINHGILALPKFNGYIKIKSYLSGKNMIIEVSNSGAEVSREKLTELNDGMNKNLSPEGSHIGLLNVNNRIKILFGEEYGCHIASSNGTTTVTVLLPQNSDDD